MRTWHVRRSPRVLHVRRRLADSRFAPSHLVLHGLWCTGKLILQTGYEQKHRKHTRKLQYQFVNGFTRKNSRHSKHTQTTIPISEWTRRAATGKKPKMENTHKPQYQCERIHKKKPKNLETHTQTTIPISEWTWRGYTGKPKQNKTHANHNTYS